MTRKYSLSLLLSFRELEALKKQIEYLLNKIKQREDYSEYENGTK